tara:strand:+ start:290 stop:610 length:321 start_codon:yes stop_codon:yes gene_type:complete
MLTFIISTFSYASFPVSEKAESISTEVSFPVSETDSNKKTSFFKSIKESLGIEWGSFFAGFFLSWIGVLLVYAFGGDTSSAWRGFGVALLLYLALYAVVLGAYVAV